MLPVRPISEVVIAWTPNRPEFHPPGFRGKSRAEPLPGVGLEQFARKAGASDERAHHPLASVRQAYVLSVAREMQQDGASTSCLMAVAEYADVQKALAANADPVPAAPVLTCPKCGGNELVQPPTHISAINPHAVTDLTGRTQSPAPLAANPDAAIRCVGCGERWHEEDLTGPRFESLRKQYSEATT